MCLSLIKITKACMLFGKYGYYFQSILRWKYNQHILSLISKVSRNYTNYAVNPFGQLPCLNISHNIMGQFNSSPSVFSLNVLLIFIYVSVQLILRLIMVPTSVNNLRYNDITKNVSERLKNYRTCRLWTVEVHADNEELLSETVRKYTTNPCKSLKGLCNDTAHVWVVTVADCF